VAGIARTTDITEQYICQAKKLLFYFSVIIRYICNDVTARAPDSLHMVTPVLDAGHETIRPLSLLHRHDHRRPLVTVGICKLSGKTPYQQSECVRCYSYFLPRGRPKMLPIRLESDIISVCSTFTVSVCRFIIGSFWRNEKTLLNRKSFDRYWPLLVIEIACLIVAGLRGGVKKALSPP
jgi:hypothetical protein